MGRLKQITWDFTKNCNLRCVSCYNCADKNQEIHNIDSVLEKINKSGIEAVHILGGEPLVNKNMRYVLSKLKKQGIAASLVANGAKLTADVFEDLKQLGLSVLCVSLDGLEEINDFTRGKGTYRLVINNLKNIREKYGEGYFQDNNMDKPQVSISHTITSRNVDSFLHFAMEMYQIGVRNITLGFIFNADNEKRNNKSLSFSREQKEYVLSRLEKAFEILSAECKDMIFNVQLRPLYVKYLNMKYGNNFKYTTGYTKCKARQDFLYLDANGDIHPCNVYSLEGIINFDLDQYMSLELNVKDVYSLSEALFHPRFELFHKMYKTAKDVNARYHTFIPTIICEVCFVKEYCEPCPFKFYEREHYLECEIAYEYYIHMYDQIKDKIIEIPENFTCTMDSQFSKMASKTVEEAVEKSGAIDLFGSVDWKILQRILKLQKKGLINVV